MKLRFLAAFLLLATLAFSQATKSTDHKAANKKAAAPAAAQQGPPKPAPEQGKIMKMFSGKWTVEATMAATPFGPADTGTGTETNYRGPGGYSVLTNTTMKFAKMGPLSGHGVMWWDPQAKTYMGIWCDNWGPCSNDGPGQWEGDKLIFTNDMKMGERTVKARQTFSDITADGFTFVLEMSDASGAMQPWMNFKYTRAAAAAAPAAPKEEKK